MKRYYAHLGRKSKEKLVRFFAKKRQKKPGQGDPAGQLYA
jgi:hypothetical protein